jgi:aspartyl-tRNA(Asn)/glutamyl-tRNA(Gln) amidotransferase subunit B
VERALRFEAERQREALGSGETLIQETRHWDEDKGVTLPLRSKEYAFDYRYFPEPDLAPVEPDAQWIERLRADLPELPASRRKRFAEQYGLHPAHARLVGSSGEWADFFEQAVALGADPRAAANWITGDLAGLLNEQRIELPASRATPQHVATIVRLVSEGTISTAGGKQALAEAFASGAPIEEIVEKKGLAQISDESALLTIVDEVVAENPGPAEQFRGGKEGVIGFLVGQVMKKTGGAANPQEAQRLLRQRLS